MKKRKCGSFSYVKESKNMYLWTGRCTAVFCRYLFVQLGREHYNGGKGLLMETA